MNLKKLCCLLLSAATVAVFAPAAVAAKPTAATSSTTVLTSAVASVKAEKTVKQYTVSHSGQKIAFIKKGTGDAFALCVMTVADKKLIKVAKLSGMLYDPKWSYDDKYLSVEDGTAVTKVTHIVTVSTLRNRWAVQNTGMVWAKKSESIAFSVVNPSVKQVVETELDGATDVIVYNIDTIKYKRIIKADARYDYQPAKLDGTELTVKRSSLVGGKIVMLNYSITK